jgi:hypothetical protein
MKTEEWTFNDYKKWTHEMREDFCLKQDDDLMVLFCGLERSGKTTNALYWGCDLDPDFISKNVCFLNKEYMNLQRSIPRKQPI